MLKMNAATASCDTVLPNGCEGRDGHSSTLIDGRLIVIGGCTQEFSRCGCTSMANGVYRPAAVQEYADMNIVSMMIFAPLTENHR